MNDTPAPLPADLMDSPEPPLHRDELPLHLRVLRAIVEGESDKEHIDQALALAHEIYELEAANVALEYYRSAS